MTLQTNALLYLRSVCRDDAFIAEQLEDCTGYTNVHDWCVLDAIADNGVDGRGNAPGLLALRDRIVSSEAPATIANDVSRIPRDADQVHSFARLFQQHRVDFCFVDQPISIDTLLKMVDSFQNASYDKQRTAREDSL